MSIANEALMALIRGRLISDCRLSALAIDVRCREGSVALVGRVDSDEQKRLAIELVKGMIGVCSVSDELTVCGAGVTTTSRAVPRLR